MMSSRKFSKMMRDFERNGEIFRYSGFVLRGAVLTFIGYHAIVAAKNIFVPEPASGCFNNAADNGALYLTYEGDEPKKASDSWKVSVDGKTCHTDNPFVPVNSVPVVTAP